MQNRKVIGALPVIQEFSPGASGFQLALLPEASHRRIGEPGPLRGGAGPTHAALDRSVPHRARNRPVNRPGRRASTPSRPLSTCNRWVLSSCASAPGDGPAWDGH